MFNSEIVSVIDSGVDYNHTFFYDSSTSLSINETNFDHRKIVQYDSLYGSEYDHTGHGTLICGLICGMPEAEDAANKLYEGFAPKAH